jgi:hypothetical protein
MSVAKQKISYRSMKKGVSLREILILVGVIIMLVFGRHVLRLLKQMFGPSQSTLDAQAALEAAQNSVSNISVNSSNLTITIQQARLRADNIYNALRGWTEDEDTVFMNLSRGWKPSFWSTKSAIRQWTEDAPSTVKLSSDDLKLIFKEFGLRTFGYSWFSKKLNLKQAISEYDSGSLRNWSNHIFQNSGIL